MICCMAKIKKPKKESRKYSLQKLNPETNLQLKDLSRVKGEYIIDILGRLVDKEYKKVVEV